MKKKISYKDICRRYVCVYAMHIWMQSDKENSITVSFYAGYAMETKGQKQSRQKIIIEYYTVSYC